MFSCTISVARAPVLLRKVSRGPVAQPEAMPGQRRGQQGLDLVLVQVGHRVRGGLLERDVEDPAAQLGVPGWPAT